MQDSVRAECIRLSTMGIACHWVRPRDKAPIHYGWAKCGWLSPSYLDSTYRPGYNVGIHTGRVVNAPVQLVAVDLDSEQALLWALRNLPVSTLRTKTSKGEHWFYLAPSGVSVGNRAKLIIDGARIDIDLRGDGGQVVCAPSVHPSGFVYQQLGHWNEFGLSGLFRFDPSWFPVVVSRPAPPSKTEISGSVSTNSLLYRRAEGLLKAMIRKGEVYERGRGQGSKVFTAARILQNDFGLSESDTYHLLATIYNPACPQPYDEISLRRKVRQASTNGHSVTRHFTVVR